MTTNGFSIFGFDLFGLARSVTGDKKDSSAKAKVEPRDEEAQRDYPDIQREAFLWGMYPVY